MLRSLTILAFALLSIPSTGARSIAQDDSASAPARFEFVKKALPGVLKVLTEGVVKISKERDGSFPMTRLHAVPTIVRMTSASQAKITVTAEWTTNFIDPEKTVGGIKIPGSYVKSDGEGFITLYLRDYSGKWTVTDWECSWSKEKSGETRYHFFAHLMVRHIDGLADKYTR